MGQQSWQALLALVDGPLIMAAVWLLLNHRRTQARKSGSVVRYPDRSVRPATDAGGAG